jgi:type VI secretion system protein ImpI
MQLLLTLRNAETFGVAEAQKRVSGSLSIGRGKQAGWPLPDPTRMLSAVHCEIRQDKRGFTLTDFSRNGTRLNGEAIVRMEPVAISSGNQIEIGPYLIGVGLDDGWEDSLGEKTVVSTHLATYGQGEKTVIAKSALPAGPAEEMVTLHPADKKPRKAAVLRQAPGNLLSRSTSSRKLVDAFCEGASIDPDTLAGRSDLEFATELGKIMRILVSSVHEMSQTMSELRTVIGSSEKSAVSLLDDGAAATGAAQKRKQTDRLLALYFGHLQADEASADETLGAVIDDAMRHNRALFFSMQTALFRLLNELSPAAIERDTNTGVLRSQSAKNWNAYVRKWEALNTGGEDGLLDVFLRYFSEAYDAKMQTL